MLKLQKANAFESMDIDNEDMFGGKEKGKEEKEKLNAEKKTKKKGWKIFSVYV